MQDGLLHSPRDGEKIGEDILAIALATEEGEKIRR